METNTKPKARCYQEFCCDEATTGITDYDLGETGPVVGGYQGRWGFCSQHQPRQLPSIAAAHSEAVLTARLTAERNA